MTSSASKFSDLYLQPYLLHEFYWNLSNKLDQVHKRDGKSFPKNVLASRPQTKDTVLALIEKMEQSAQEEKNNRLQVSARELFIWGSWRSQYWKWDKTDKYMSGDLIEVAELIKVIWLLISGKYDPAKLTEGVNYEVNFVVELKNNLVMNGPVTLTLTHETRETRTEDLNQKPKNQEIKLKVGEFIAKRDCGVQFAMRNLTGTWQQGLVIIGASISAKV